MTRILHITAHMGGGVGKVLSALACYSRSQSSSYTHDIVLLEEPENPFFYETCKNANVSVNIIRDSLQLQKEMENSDIVQIEWWHHPLMVAFLSSFPQVPVRLVIWSHISGCSYPYLLPEFVLKPHFFLFTSRYSYDNPEWSASQKSTIVEKTLVINSSGGFASFAEKSLLPHEGFNIGYAGTLSYSKLHPDFIGFCSGITVPGVKFVMVGQIPEPNLIETDALSEGIIGNITFLGHVPDLADALSQMDILGYLLNPDHYGTTENTLLEAMAMGIPVVALNQCAEKYLITDKETGLLVNNKGEYWEAVHYLHDNPDERTRLGRNARNHVLSEYSLSNTVEKIDSIYEKVMTEGKRSFSFLEIFGSRPYEWFLSGLSTEKQYFHMSIDQGIRQDPRLLQFVETEIKKSRQIIRGESKSSINQFFTYFPDDKWLNYWAMLVRNNET